MLSPNQVDLLRSLVRQELRRMDRKREKLAVKFGEGADLAQNVERSKFLTSLDGDLLMLKHGES